MHPWSLRPPPPGRTVLALCDAAFHRQFPWTARRWAFVGAALQAAPPRWCDEPQALLQALAAARSVQGDWDRKRAGNTPRELESYQRDAPGCQRCGSNSSIRPAGCVGSRVSTSLM